MTYCGVNTDLFEGIPCIGGLLSVSEMLQSKRPKIAGALLRYAIALIQNYLVQMGSSHEIDESLASLNKLASAGPAATAGELERFADALIAAADGETLVEFNKIGYMCYTAGSLYGPLPNRVLQKLAKTEQVLGVDAPVSAHGAVHPSLASGYQSQPKFTPSDEEKPEEPASDTDRPQELLELALRALNAGVYDVALTAVMAAGHELKRQPQ